MADLGDLRGPGRFDPEGDANSVSLRWKAWLEEFQCFADCKGVTDLPNDRTNDEKRTENRSKRRALLLYLAGPKLRTTFNSLEITGNEHLTQRFNAMFSENRFKMLTKLQHSTCHV